MKFTHDQIQEKLREINQRVLDKIGSPTKEQEAYDTIKRVASSVAGDLRTSDEMRDKLDTVLKSGMLDRKEVITDQDQAERFELELTSAIHRAIKTGQLPNPKSDPFVRKMNRTWRKRGKK